jgi:cold shock CspA family protein
MAAASSLISGLAYMPTCGYSVSFFPLPARDSFFFAPTHQLRNTIMSSAERLTGILIKWDATKGYGFIKVLGSKKDYFLRNKLIRAEQRTSVAVGRCLSFVPMKTERGLEAWAPSLIHSDVDTTSAQAQ